MQAANGRYPEAIDLYRKAIEAIPLPDYAASLGDVYAKIGRAEEARKQYALVEYIGRLNALNRGALQPRAGPLLRRPRHEAG